MLEVGECGVNIAVSGNVMEFSVKKVVAMTAEDLAARIGRAGLEVAAQIEPKPGIPPSPSHTAELISLIRQAGIRALVVEPFYDAAAAE